VQRALEHDADVLQLTVKVCRGGEAEAESDQLRRGYIDVKDADHERAAE
jgi:hypothetical protein